MTFKFNLQLFGEGLSIPGIDEDILKELQDDADTGDEEKAADEGGDNTGNADADSENKQVTGDNGGDESGEQQQQQEDESEADDDEELPEGSNIPYQRFKSVNERRKAAETGRKAAEAKVKELEAQLAALKGTNPAAPPAPAANVPFKQPQAQAQQQPAPTQQQPDGGSEFNAQQIERIAQMAIQRAKAKLNLTDDDVANLDYSDKPELKVAYNNIVAEEMRNIRIEVQQYKANRAAFEKQINDTAQEFDALSNKLGAYEDARQRWDFIGEKHFLSLPPRKQQVLKDAFARLQHKRGTYQDMDMINDYFESANKLYEQQKAAAAAADTNAARTKEKMNSVRNLPKATSVNGSTGADKILTVERLREILATPGGWDKLSAKEQEAVLSGKLR